MTTKKVQLTGNKQGIFSFIPQDEGFTDSTSRVLANFIVNSKSKLPNVRDLLIWLFNNKPNTQQINIHQWYGTKWYIVVEYSKEEQLDYPKHAQIGFTFDIEADQVIWSNDKELSVAGGNCFTRNHRWRKLLKERFGVEDNVEFHWYKETTPQKLRAMREQ